MEPLFQSVQAARTGVQTLLVGFLRGPFLLEENRLLREQIETLITHEQTHRDLFQENQRLKELLGFKATVAWRLTPAQVVARETSVWSRSFLIDKGREEGVQVGQAVITSTGLVGRVSEVGSSLSRIVLITDPHFRVAATVSQSRLSGLLMGRSFAGCLLTYLPREAKLRSGDSVVTAGGKSFAPDGIPIGVIQQVGEESDRPAESNRPADSELFRSVRVEPAVKLSRVEELFLVAWPSSDSDLSS